MAKRKYEKFYNYKCTITDEEFTLTKEAPNPSELTSVKAYYEMHPEEDDRPEHIKILAKQELEKQASLADSDIDTELN